MNLVRFFTIDINLVMCLAAAWLIEIVLGAPSFFSNLSTIVAKFVYALADKALVLGDHAVFHTNGRDRSEPQNKGRIVGVFFVIYLLLFAFILTAVILDFAFRLHPSLYYILNTIIIYLVLNTRSAADRAVLMRKTQPESEGISRIIANLSKNCLDGICAPIIYSSIGVVLGVPAVFAAVYKTLFILNGTTGYKDGKDGKDGMDGKNGMNGNDGKYGISGIGGMNGKNGMDGKYGISGMDGNDCNDGKYGNLGWAAVKLYGAVNFFPARICGILLPLLAPLCGMGAKGARRGLRATREAHAAQQFSNNYDNLNEAWPEAAIAGVLGINLGGSGRDFGDLKVRMREPEAADIKKAIRLMFMASAAVLMVCCGILAYWYWYVNK